MKRATAKFIRTLFAGAVLAACPVLAFAQQPQAMCRETLETWVRDKSLNAKWNGDHTAVIMVRGGVEYICTCPSQTRPPVCKPVASTSAAKAKGSDVPAAAPAGVRGRAPRQFEPPVETSQARKRSCSGSSRHRVLSSRILKKARRSCWGASMREQRPGEPRSRRPSASSP